MRLLLLLLLNRWLRIAPPTREVIKYQHLVELLPNQTINRREMQFFRFSSPGFVFSKTYRNNLIFVVVAVVFRKLMQEKAKL